MAFASNRIGRKNEFSFRPCVPARSRVFGTPNKCFSQTLRSRRSRNCEFSSRSKRRRRSPFTIRSRRIYAPTRPIKHAAFVFPAPRTRGFRMVFPGIQSYACSHGINDRDTVNAIRTSVTCVMYCTCVSSCNA